LLGRCACRLRACRRYPDGHARAPRRARLAIRIASARSKPASAATSQSGTSTALRSSSIAWATTRCTPACGRAS